jgi:hypothetical protein
VSSMIKMVNTTESEGRRAPIVRNLVASPAVLREARKMTGCPTLPGAEIEVASQGLHWSSRVFGDEIMSASPLGAVPSKLSPLTLAFFEDTGWYRVDYARAEGITWGLTGGGCAFFASQPCPVDPEYLCPGDGSAGARWSRCYAGDRRYRTQCSVKKAAVPQPDQYVYPLLLGAGWQGSEIFDYCPLALPSSAPTMDCTANATELREDARAYLHMTSQSLSPASMCHEGRLDGAEGPLSLCHETRCTLTEVWVLAGIWRTCAAGSEVRVASPPGYAVGANSFRCPSRAEASCPGSGINNSSSSSDWPAIKSVSFEWDNEILVARVSGDRLNATSGTLSITVCKQALDASGQEDASAAAALPCSKLSQAGKAIRCHVDDKVNEGFRYLATYTFVYSDASGRSAVLACARSGMGVSYKVYLIIGLMLGLGVVIVLGLAGYAWKRPIRSADHSFHVLGQEEDEAAEVELRTLPPREAAAQAAEIRAQRAAAAAAAQAAAQNIVAPPGTIVVNMPSPNCQQCGADVGGLPSALRSHQEVCPGRRA